MNSLKKVGLEFLGITEERDLSKSPIISFPKLEEISFIDFEQWEIWEASEEVTKGIDLQ